MSKQIDLTNIPKRGKLYDWKNSIGIKCSFIYNNISGEIEIVDYTYKYVTIKYKDKTDKLTTDSFVRCSLGKVLGVRTNDFKVDIGITFKNDKRNITIIDREYRVDDRGISRKWYKYKCNVCTWDNGWMRERHLLKGIGCSCCRGFTVVRGINDISTTHPEYLPYFVDINDAYTHTYSSADVILLKCPICNEEKHISLSQFHTYGLACGICSDGISYGEKFMYSLLKQLNVKFIKEYSKKDNPWCNDYRYDFYLPENNAIIEVHGGLHTDNGRKRGNYKSLEETKENDRLKKELAINNNIKHYIEIDCHRSTFDIIKNSILNSNLPKLLNFNECDINWEVCEKYTSTSLVKEVCDYKNSHEEMSTTEIADVFGLVRTTIQTYLQRGANAGFCIYDNELEMKRGRQRAVKNRMINAQL